MGGSSEGPEVLTVQSQILNKRKTHFISSTTKSNFLSITDNVSLALLLDEAGMLWWRSCCRGDIISIMGKSPEGLKSPIKQSHDGEEARLKKTEASQAW